MQITISKRAAVIIALMLLMALPATAAAMHVFTDVSDGSVHAAGIDWVADVGVTSGCGDGSTYCPNDPVTRAQMATFMHRLSGTAPGIAPSVAAAAALEADTATTAGDADTLDGLDGTDFAAAAHTHAQPMAVAVGSTIDQTNSTADTTWYDLPTATTTVDLPYAAGLLTARFTAESMCTGGDYASIRILLDGTELTPASETDQAFDSSDGATETAFSWESHAMERFTTDVVSGSHTVTVQWNSGCTEFRIDDWSLVVDAYPTGSASLTGTVAGVSTSGDQR